MRCSETAHKTTATPGEFEKAIDAYKKALDLTTQSYERGRISNELLKLYVQVGDNDLALELYENQSQSSPMGSVSFSMGPSGLKIRSGGDEARETLINAYKDQGKLEALETLFKNKLETDAQNPAVLEMVAEIYRNASDHEKAAETYQALCKAQPSNVNSFFYAAAALQKSDQPELAKEMLSQAEVAISTNPRAQFDMLFLMTVASICVEGELYDSAIKLAEDALAVISRMGGGVSGLSEYLYGMLGESYLGAKRYEEAADAYKQMATLAQFDQMREMAEKGIRQAYTEGNLHEKQIPEQLQKIQENPDDLDTRFALAENYELSDKVDEAIAQYQKISELQPDDAQWQKKIGDLHQKQQTDEGVEGPALDQAAAAYQKAIQLEPTSYELYNLLAQTHEKADRLAEAETVYRQALETSLEDSEHDAAIRSIWKLYADTDQKDKGIAVLEALKPKVGTSVSLFELLGDAYKAAGDIEKADAAYTEWLTIRQKEANRRQSPAGYRNLARQILDKGIMPEKGLEYAERASQMGSGGSYTETLAQAYIANDRYEEALTQIKQRLNTMERDAFGRWLAPWISRVGKNATDKTRYVEMLDTLVDTAPNTLTDQVDINLKLAEFCRENAMPEKAKTYIQRTGVITEDKWLILGPFDNTNGIGYDTAYIAEDATQIDTTAEYDGVDGSVKWQKSTDDTLNGYIDLGQDVNWRVAYCFATVTSPDERKAQIRFDSDDQGKVFLNGEQVVTNTGAHSVRIDRYTTPVTLKPGENSILVKVCNEEVKWEFYLRITDPNGKPFTDLKISSAN